MKIGSIEVKQLYPVSKLTKRQEAGSRTRSVKMPKLIFLTRITNSQVINSIHCLNLHSEEPETGILGNKKKIAA